MSDIDDIFHENYLYCKEFVRRYYLARALAGYEFIDITDPSTRLSYEIMQHYQMCRDILEDIYGDVVDF